MWDKFNIYNYKYTIHETSQNQYHLSPCAYDVIHPTHLLTYLRGWFIGKPTTVAPPKYHEKIHPILCFLCILKSKKASSPLFTRVYIATPPSFYRLSLNLTLLQVELLHFAAHWKHQHCCQKQPCQLHRTTGWGYQLLVCNIIWALSQNWFYHSCSAWACFRSVRCAFPLWTSSSAAVTSKLESSSSEYSTWWSADLLIVRLTFR